MPPDAQTKGTWSAKAAESRDGLASKKKLVDSEHVERTSVSFQDTVRYREIEPLTDVSEDEIRRIWYGDEEYAGIKKAVTSTVKKASAGEVVDEAKGLSMRGLEGRTKFGARRRKNNKAAALDAVWTTQIELWKRKGDNPLAIASAYKPHSTHARYRALEAAHTDELYVRTHVREREL